MKALLVALIPVVTLGAVGPAAPPQALPTPWLGITLGEPESDVIHRYGETGFFALSGGITGDLNYINYNIDHVHGTIGVRFTNGRVSSVSLGRSSWDESTPNMTDPFGISPGATLAQVTQQRGKSNAASDTGWHTEIYDAADGSTWNYGFAAGVLRAVTWKTSPEASRALQPLNPPALHPGTSSADALINSAPDEESGAYNERQYLTAIRCTGGRGIPLETSQRLTKVDGKEYDDISLSCPIPPAGKSEIFFDVTAFFGKA